MRIIDRWFVIPFVTVLAILVGGQVIGWDRVPDFLYRWQTLATGILALLGAAGVLIAAKWQVDAIKFVADRDVRQKRRAARMYVVSLLEDFCLRCDQIVSDIDNWHRSEGAFGKDHMRLPQVLIPANVAEMALLPEVESLFRFARNIDRINDNAALLFEITSTLDEAMRYVRIRAASSAVRAYVWRNRLGQRIGWKPMRLPDGRIDDLRKVASEAEGEDAANLPDDD